MEDIIYKNKEFIIELYSRKYKTVDDDFRYKLINYFDNNMFYNFIDCITDIGHSYVCGLTLDWIFATNPVKSARK